ncbi:MAG TPA: hypothetical protein PLV25_01665, partial [Opitutales bacterium]|nr:hypothetical protein [Opitutales bacterium]
LGATAHSNTLTVSAGESAIIDVGFRSDSAVLPNGVVLNDDTILAAGGTLGFTSSRASDPNITITAPLQVNGNLLGQGTGTGVANSVLSLAASLAGVSVGVTPIAGGVTFDPSVVITINGTTPGGLLVTGPQAYVDNLLTPAILNNLKAGVPCTSGADAGTLMVGYSNSGTSTGQAFDVVRGPASPLCVNLGFTSVSNNAPVYLIGGATAQTLNWNGLVVAGGTAQCVNTVSFVGPYTTAGLQLGSGAVNLMSPSSTPCNMSFAGGLALAAGAVIEGGSTGGYVVAGGPAVVNGAATLNGNLQAPAVNIGLNGALTLGANGLTLQTSGPAPIPVTLGAANASLLTGGFNSTWGVLTQSGGILDLGQQGITHFADSSGATWSGTISIKNWNGNAAGGGTTQIYFGTSSAGADFTKIQFVNPFGLSATVGAQILSTGEVVPAAASIYSFTNGNGNTLFSTAANWQGGAAPVNSPTSVIVFNTAGVAAAANDITSPLQLGFMGFGAVLNQILSVTGNAFDISSGGLTMNANQAVNVANAITFEVNPTNLVGAGTGLCSLSGVIDGSNPIALNSGNWAFQNTANTFTGALTVNGAVLNVTTATSTDLTVGAQSSSSYLGTGATNFQMTSGGFNLLAGGALNIQRPLTFTGGEALLQAQGNVNLATGVALDITETTVTIEPFFGGSGPTPSGLLNPVGGAVTLGLNGQILLDGVAVGGSGITFLNAITVGGSSVKPSVIANNKSSLAYDPTVSPWQFNQLRFGPASLTGSSGTGVLSLAMTNGAIATLDTTDTTAQLVFSGQPNGDPSADSFSTSVGRFNLRPGTNVLSLSQPLIFNNTVQVSIPNTARTIAADMDIVGGQTAFSGRYTGTDITGSFAANRLQLGQVTPVQTLTIRAGAVGICDVGDRNDLNPSYQAGVQVNSPVTIEPAGMLEFTWSRSNNTPSIPSDGIQFSTTITGQGSSGLDSIVLFNSTITGVVLGTSPTQGQVAFDPTLLGITVAGSGAHGLRVQGNQALVDGLLTAQTLQALQGQGVCATPVADQGTLTIAYTNSGSSASRTLTAPNAPAAPSCVLLGLAAAGGNAPMFVLNDSASTVSQTLANWNGLVVNGTHVACDGNVAFSGTNAGAQLWLAAGQITLANAGNTACNIAFAGGARITGGSLAGGASGGVLSLGGFAAINVADSFSIGGRLSAPNVVVVNGVVDLTDNDLVVNNPNVALLGASTGLRTHGYSEQFGVLVVFPESPAAALLDLGSAGVVNF